MYTSGAGAIGGTDTGANNSRVGRDTFSQGVNRAVGAHCGLVIDVESCFFATGVNPVLEHGDSTDKPLFKLAFTDPTSLIAFP